MIKSLDIVKFLDHRFGPEGIDTHTGSRKNFANQLDRGRLAPRVLSHELSRLIVPCPSVDVVHAEIAVRQNFIDLVDSCWVIPVIFAR